MRFTGYQAGRRWQGVRVNIAMILAYLENGATRAIDIGSNEGVLTCALDAAGVQATGYEQSQKFFDRAKALNEQLGGKTQFENALFTLEDAKAMRDIDTVLFLSVHHQIAANVSLANANEMLCALVENSKQVFFQPACISAKYGQDMPFADNDYAAIIDYFNDVVRDVAGHVTMAGFAQNDLPRSEPLRPMLIYSREPAKMRAGTDIAATLDRFGKAVNKVYNLGMSLNEMGRKLKRRKRG